MFKVFMATVLIIVSFCAGMVAQIYYQEIKEKNQTYEIIMLKIPKNEKELQNQYLSAYAQVTMLEQMIMWNTKMKLLSKGEKK